MEPLVTERDLSEPKIKSINAPFVRFIVGAIIGLMIAGAYWGTSVYFEYSVPIEIGIIGCILLSIICGLMILKFGYGILEKLLENIR
jgi:sorbitol-specific phosphotransferase system component IIBC